jgi:CubicO group peptidase (beta-lactamase class C family)
MDGAGIAPGPNPPALPPDELMSAFGQLPLMHQPGQRWLYHTSFDFLGVLIARAAGERFEDFLAARIFAPLGMKDTAFGVPEAKRGRLAACYQANAATGGLVPRGGGRFAVSPSGSTGLFSMERSPTSAYSQWRRSLASPDLARRQAPEERKPPSPQAAAPGCSRRSTTTLPSAG